MSLWTSSSKTLPCLELCLLLLVAPTHRLGLNFAWRRRGHTSASSSSSSSSSGGGSRRTRAALLALPLNLFAIILVISLLRLSSFCFFFSLPHSSAAHSAEPLGWDSAAGCGGDLPRPLAGHRLQTRRESGPAAPLDTRRSSPHPAMARDSPSSRPHCAGGNRGT